MQKNNDFLQIFCPEYFIFHNSILSLHRFSDSSLSEYAVWVAKREVL